MRASAAPRDSGPTSITSAVRWRTAYSSPASSPCARPARAASASSTAPSGGRCTSRATTSADAGSAQCTSSRSSVTGRAAASRASSARTARATRWRSTAAAGVRPVIRAIAGSATARSASSPAAMPGATAPTWSSRASTHSANGTSLSSSVARPASTRCPRSAARRPSSPSSRDLPIPGSPTIPTAREPAWSSARSSERSSASRPTSAPVARIAPHGTGYLGCTRHARHSQRASCEAATAAAVSVAGSRCPGSRVQLVISRIENSRSSLEDCRLRSNTCGINVPPDANRARPPEKSSVRARNLRGVCGGLPPQVVGEPAFPAARGETTMCPCSPGSSRPSPFCSRRSPSQRRHPPWTSASPRTTTAASTTSTPSRRRR